MKKLNLIKLFLLVVPCVSAFAHCPAYFKEEKLCFMLEKNLVYLYDHKFEHNGPFKDFVKASFLNITSINGEKIKFHKLSRGIYKLDSNELYKQLILEITLDTKVLKIKISHE